MRWMLTLAILGGCTGSTTVVPVREGLWQYDFGSERGLRLPAISIHREAFDAKLARAFFQRDITSVAQEVVYRWTLRVDLAMEVRSDIPWGEVAVTMKGKEEIALALTSKRNGAERASYEAVVSNASDLPEATALTIFGERFLVLP